MAGYGQQSMPRTPRSARMSSPGRPASNASIRSVASARSAQSYRKLEAQQAKDRLKNLIMIKAQMDATGRGKKFGNNNRSRLANLAEKEATRLVASGAVAGILPARFKPGFFEVCALPIGCPAPPPSSPSVLACNARCLCWASVLPSLPAALPILGFRAA